MKLRLSQRTHSTGIVMAVLSTVERVKELSSYTDMEYARFSSSAIRFSRMGRPAAEKLAERLRRLLEADLPEGQCERAQDCETEVPYRTEVQFYKTAQGILAELHRRERTAEQREICQQLRLILGDIAYHFRAAYGMEITDCRTVYALCTSLMDPGCLEPSVCLLKDWRLLQLGIDGRSPKGRKKRRAATDEKKQRAVPPGHQQA